MSGDTDAAVVQQIVEEWFSAAVLEVRHNAYGHRNRTFTVEVAERTVIVRTNADPAVFAATALNLEALRALGIPVPEVVTADLTLSRRPFAYMVMGAFPGTDLGLALPGMSQQEQELVARQVMEFERRVATLPEGHGYGYAGIGERAPHVSWRGAIALGAFSQGYSPSGIDGALVERMETILDSCEAYLEGVRPTCFLDDLTTKNVIVDEGVLQGVIDFDVVCYGDPLFQLGLTQTAAGFDLPEQCMTYVEHLCAAADLGPEQRRIVDLYAAMCGIDFLSRIPAGLEHRAGARHVERWLDRAA